MQPASQITSVWKDTAVAKQYRTGVSLHSHTSCSEETLTFVHKFVALLPGAGAVVRRYERVCEREHGLRLDFARAFWRPPLLPRMAFDLEARQIRQLGLDPLVSITDHDTIEAPMLLRTVPSARHIPVSVARRHAGLVLMVSNLTLSRMNGFSKNLYENAAVAIVAASARRSPSRQWRAKNGDWPPRLSTNITHR